MPDGHAPLRAERQARDVMVLCQVRPREIGGDGRPRGGGSDGEAGDAARRRQVALEQQWRDRQCIGDVVEAVRGVVGRQQLGYVHVDIEEVPDDVAILGAVEPMVDRGPGQLRASRPGRVEGRLEPLDERVPHLVGGPRAAGGGHGSGAQLAHHLLPRLGVRADVGRIERVELEPQAAQLSDEGRRRATLAAHNARVVAGHAVAVEQLSRGGCGCGRSARGGGRFLGARDAGPARLYADGQDDRDSHRQADRGRRRNDTPLPIARRSHGSSPARPVMPAGPARGSARLEQPNGRSLYCGIHASNRDLRFVVRHARRPPWDVGMCTQDCPESCCW